MKNKKSLIFVALGCFAAAGAAGGAAGTGGSVAILIATISDTAEAVCVFNEQRAGKSGNRSNSISAESGRAEE